MKPVLIPFGQNVFCKTHDYPSIALPYSLGLTCYIDTEVSLKGNAKGD